MIERSTCVSYGLNDSDWLKYAFDPQVSQSDKQDLCSALGTKRYGVSHKSEQIRRFREFESLEWPVKLPVWAAVLWC